MSPIIEQATPESLAGYCGMIEWAARYGNELSVPARPDARLMGDGVGIELEVSFALSASFNPGFGPDDSVYLMVTMEEYAWLSLVPIQEVVVSDTAVCVICRGIREGEFEIAMMALRLQTDQPRLWASMRGRSVIRFGCVHHSDAGYEVSEYMPEGAPLRFLSA